MSPTKLKVTSREPVKLRLGDTDTHVRLRWDGKDSLLTAMSRNGSCLQSLPATARRSPR